MPISGVIVTCEDGATEAVRRAIEARPRVELCESRETALVVVTDTATLEEDREELRWLEGLPGVLSAFVTFTNVEDLAESSVASGGRQ